MYKQLKRAEPCLVYLNIYLINIYSFFYNPKEPKKIKINNNHALFVQYGQSKQRSIKRFCLYYIEI